MWKGALLLVALGFWLIHAVDGCDFTNPTPDAPAKPAAASNPAPQQMCKADHRFEKTDVYPVGLRADIAIDSCTGQLCRTWNWQPKGDRETVWTTYQYLPLCASLPNTRTGVPAS